MDTPICGYRYTGSGSETAPLKMDCDAGRGKMPLIAYAFKILDIPLDKHERNQWKAWWREEKHRVALQSDNRTHYHAAHPAVLKGSNTELQLPIICVDLELFFVMLYLFLLYIMNLFALPSLQLSHGSSEHALLTREGRVSWRRAQYPFPQSSPLETGKVYHLTR